MTVEGTTSNSTVLFCAWTKRSIIRRSRSVRCKAASAQTLTIRINSSRVNGLTCRRASSIPADR